MCAIRIVIAEDDYFTREGIRSILEKEADIQVVGMAEQGHQALELVALQQPQILLLDLRMPPGIDGIEVIRRMRARNLETKVIALTHEPRRVWAVEEAGGNGFVPKTQFHMFVPTIRCVAQSESKVFIQDEDSRAFGNLQARIAEAKLTPAEYEVWQLIGFANEEIAIRLEKTEGRIKNLVTSLYFKLDIPKAGRVPQRIYAVQLARQMGLLEEPTID